MINEVLVDGETRWECINCGNCCHKLGAEFSQKLFSSETTEDGRCPKLDSNNRCEIYSERPLGCKMYPFYPDWQKLKLGIVDFNIGSLKIDSECQGYGKGDKVIKNKRIHKKLQKLAIKIKENIKILKQGQIKDIFSLR